MIVYKIINKINDKAYIGQSVNALNIRWSQHVHYALKNKGTSVLANAIKKYGKEVFALKVLARCDSIKEMNHKEIYFIKKLNTISPNGYNLDSGGKNKIMHQSTKDKLSRARTGKKIGPFTKKHKKNLSLAHKGRTYPNRIISTETRLKISEANSGAKNCMFGKKQTEYNKQRTAQVNKGNKYWLNRKHNEESKIKISKSKDKFKIKILCINNGVVYESLRAAAKALNISKTSINYVLSGKMSGVKGHNFERI